MKLGIIGGSGLYDMEQFEFIARESLYTPFGSPSDEYVRMSGGGHEIVFLPRHGRGHRILPSELNHRANIWGFKRLGVDSVLSVSAVGSLSEHIKPRDIVFPDQYFDRSKACGRNTFFGNGIVAHIPFGDPTCSQLRSMTAGEARKVEAAEDSSPGVHPGGVYVSMEGPAFSTRAESVFYRRMGFDIIGMTGIAEAKLCREAELCYACMALVTDYDCWHESEEEVSVELIMQNVQRNVAVARRVIAGLVKRLPAEAPDCDCRHALRHAIVTDPAIIPAAVRRDLEPLIGKYITAES